MMMDEFEVRSYGWQELAVLYGPDLMPASAGKRLSQWVGVNPELKTELQGNGWRKGDVDSPAGEDDRAISG